MIEDSITLSGKTITFFDLEVDTKTKKVFDIGSIRDNGATFHNASPTEFIQFLAGTDYICGHNILNHDLKYIGQHIENAGVHLTNVIDTLYLSPLLFPSNPYHALLKD
ncbi:MAG: hypothetical protein EOO43_12940, partial [Flavobacterium sp.]